MVVQVNAETTSFAADSSGIAMHSHSDVSIAADGNGTRANISLTAENNIKLTAGALDVEGEVVRMAADQIHVQGNVHVDGSAVRISSTEDVSIHSGLGLNVKSDDNIMVESGSDLTFTAAAGQLTLATATTTLNVDELDSVSKTEMVHLCLQEGC